jgi:hypothetical protein
MTGVIVLSLSDTIIVAALGSEAPTERESWGLVEPVGQRVTYVMGKA